MGIYASTVSSCCVVIGSSVIEARSQARIMGGIEGLKIVVNLYTKRWVETVLI
jgi:hypothetical protein